MKKISVILPVYKVEKWLNRCLESIVNQTFKNLEIILVDDGSPDNSGKLCDEWATKDKRIKVIHKENGGVSSARNIGIDKATGDYITFVDPDDYIDLTMYEKLLKRDVNNEADIIMCGFSRSYEDGQIICENELNLLKCENESILPYFFYGGREVKNSQVYTSHIMGCVWRSLFKKNIIGKTRFDNLSMCEDVLFCIKIYEKVPIVKVVNENLYYYFQSAEGVTRNVNGKMITNLKNFSIASYDIISTLLSKKDFELAKFHIYQLNASAIARCEDKALVNSFKKDDFFNKLNKRCNYKEYQRQTKGFKYKLINFILHYKLFGLYKLLRKLSTQNQTK